MKLKNISLILVANLSVIAFVLLFNLKFSENVESKLLVAIQTNDLMEVKRIFSNTQKINVEKKFGGDKRSLLHAAIESRNYDAAIKLLALGANVNAENSVGETPIYIATYNADNTMISLLLENGADANLKENRSGTYPLFLAVKSNNENAVIALLSHGASPCIKTIDGTSAIKISEHGSKEISDHLKNNLANCKP